MASDTKRTGTGETIQPPTPIKEDDIKSTYKRDELVVKSEVNLQI